MILLGAQDKSPSLEFFVTAYSVTGNVATTTTVIGIMLCIVFNVVNVVMEEGFFRGLFTKLGMQKVSFMTSNVIASLLFGLWHVAMPVRSYLDGDMTPAGMIASSMFYVVTASLMGFLLGLLSRMTGGLWASMGVHFVNNTVINLLHVRTVTGLDEMQAIRVGITQTLLFVGVVLAYIIWCRRHAPALQLDNK